MDHTNIIPLIKNGLFFDLPKHLYNDTCDILLLISDDQKLISLLKHVIESIISLWFDHDEMDRDNYQMWTPTEDLRNHHRKLHKNPSTDNMMQATMNFEIAKSLRKRFRVATQNNRAERSYRDFQRLFLGAKNLKPSQLNVGRE